MPRRIAGLIDLFADATGFVRGFSTANQATDRFQKQTSRTMAKARRSVNRFRNDFNRTFNRKFAAGVGALFSTASAQAAINFGDAIGKSARSAGIAAEQFQELRIALADSGDISFDQTRAGLSRFNSVLGQAKTGSAGLKKSFQALGVDLSGTTGAVLDETLQRLGSIRDDSLRAQFAAKFFGEEMGPKLAASLEQGNAAFAALRKNISGNGGVLTNQAVANAERLSSVLFHVSNTIKVKFTEAVLSNESALIRLANLANRILVTVTQAGQLAKAASEQGGLVGGAIGLTRARIDARDTQYRYNQQADYLRRLREEGRKAIPIINRQFTTLADEIDKTTKRVDAAYDKMLAANDRLQGKLNPLQELELIKFKPITAEDFEYTGNPVNIPAEFDLGTDTTDEILARMEELQKKTSDKTDKELEKAAKRAEDARKRYEDARNRFARDAARSFTDAIRSARNFEEAIISVGDRLRNLILELTVYQPLENFLTRVFGGAVSERDRSDSRFLGGLLGNIFGGFGGSGGLEQFKTTPPINPSYGVQGGFSSSGLVGSVAGSPPVGQSTYVFNAPGASKEEVASLRSTVELMRDGFGAAVKAEVVRARVNGEL